MLKLATPPLTSLSAHELKTLVTGRIKLRLRLKNGYHDRGFIIKGNVGITLRRIELRDRLVPLPIVANIESNQQVAFGLGRSKLLTTMEPCPILVQHTQSK